jgi:hypothetical protein
VPDADVESGHIVLPMRVAGDVPGCYDVPNLACQLVDASSASYSATRIACTVPAGVGRGFQVCLGCAFCFCDPSLCAPSSLTVSLPSPCSYGLR